jgi:HD superfamily phosphodiesterase
MQTIKETLIDEMKQYFDGDTKRINHASKVLDYAEQIHEIEKGDELVITAAAILHDIGIKVAEAKHGSSAGIYQQIEGPPIARKILEKYDIPTSKIIHICDIISDHHFAIKMDSTEFKIVYDADWLVNLPDIYENTETEKLQHIINKTFKTETGKNIAFETYIKIKTRNH